MTREARVVLPGAPHHVTQRGVRRTNVFRDDADRENYLKIFRKSAKRFGLRICAYCLMDNHVHFVVIPNLVTSIWRTFHLCHSIYAAYFNEKYSLSGHLWQGRPFSCVLDEDHLWAAVRYVERNPVRASMVDRAAEYRWSSAAAHCGFRFDPLLNDDWFLQDLELDWNAWLQEEGERSELIQDVRSNTRTGKPCGDRYFIQSIEHRLGRALIPRRQGRKPKVKIN